MKTELKRRDFVSKCFKAGLTCCALVYGNSLLGQEQVKQKGQKPDPKSLTYCGYTCPDDCPLKKATVENNTELKKKAYEIFKYKEKYGIEFDPEKVFCYGCKVPEKQQGINVKSCTVRSCVIAKGYDCCIQCNGLADCDKELWKSFPDFRKAVIEMQKKYQSA